jgi:hypothetical protein
MKPPLFQPGEVNLVRNVVLHPNRHDENESDHERETGKIVDVLGGFRDCREGIGTHHRQQQMLAECDVEPGQCEHDK